VYLGAPVAKTFWAPLLIGIAGAARLIPLCRNARLPEGTKLIGLVASAVFFLQSATAIHAGKQNYYGKGHLDQINYVFLSEFIRTESFHTPPNAGDHSPWLLKGLQTKEKRIGQSVAAAYVASASFTDSKDSLAACVSFALALLASLVFALGRSLALPLPLAALAAFWTGLSPAMTRIAIEGFFSQVEAIFVYCFLLLWAASARKLSTTHVALPAIALSFQFVTYTESYLVSFALFGLCVLFLTWRMGRGAFIAGLISAAAAPLFVPMYLVYALRFIEEQYTFASAARAAVEVLAPDAGTLIGWSRGLVAFPLVPAHISYSLGIITAIVLIALCAAALMTNSLRKRALLALAVLTPWVFLTYLLSAQSFLRYPFWKLIDSFAFLWIVLAILGIARTAKLLPRKLATPAALACGTVLALSGAAGFVGQHRAAMARPGGLAVFNSPDFVSAINFAASHPDRTYLVRESDATVASWLIYHARNSKTFVAAPGLSDILLTGSKFAFQKNVPVTGSTTQISRFGIRDASTNLPQVDIAVSNPQGEDRLPSGAAYWLGDSMQLEFTRWAQNAPAAEYRLAFLAEPGPANPARNRELALVNLVTGARNQIRIAAAETVTVPIILSPGANRFLLQSIAPTEHLVKSDTDPRKHLTFVRNFALTPTGTEIPAGDPRLTPAPTAFAPPELRFTNSQGEDRQGAVSWFWVADEMTIEIARADNASRTHIFTLSFDAEPGPANPSKTRKLRIAGKTFDINGSGRITAEVPAPPGVSQWKLQIVDPPPQTNRIPGDPRNHMLRVERFEIAFLREAGAPVPLSPREKAAAAPAR